MTSVKVEDHPLERIYDVLEVTHCTDKHHCVQPLLNTDLGVSRPNNSDPHFSVPKVFCDHLADQGGRADGGPGGRQGELASGRQLLQVVLDIEPRLRATFPKNAVKKKIKVGGRSDE